MSNPLQKLAEHGQSVWLDFISRELVTSGELERMMREDNVTGMTSNPTIFEKAIAEGSDYDAQIRELVQTGVDDPNDVFLDLAITDIQRAADALRPVFDRTGGADGFVSLEVPPGLAHDTDRTIEAVGRIWQRVQRPNLMVKIPATLEGLPAIRSSLREGRNINVTLVFALAMYDGVIDQYIEALEARHEQQLSLDVHSVGSFFVSRVDTVVDKLSRRSLQPTRETPPSRTCLAKPPSRTRFSPTKNSSCASAMPVSPAFARPARTCSARCGPAPARRTPTIAMLSTPRL